MKVAFCGYSDEFIGLANACPNFSFIDENNFEFFKKNKPDVVVFRLDDFSRPLFKNLAIHKIAGICIANSTEHKKLEQARGQKLNLITVDEQAIVGFDDVRYAVGVAMENLREQFVWFPDDNLINSTYHKLRRPGLKIYYPHAMFLPEYAGWPDDKQIPNIVKSAETVLYHKTSDYITYNTLRLIGCGGNVKTTGELLPTYDQVMEKYTYKTIAKKIGLL